MGCLLYTSLRDFDRAYDLGDNEFHLAFTVDDFDAALAKHKEMNCVCFENPAMGIYFINDPDGYWLEVLPVKGLSLIHIYSRTPLFCAADEAWKK